MASKKLARTHLEMLAIACKRGRFDTRNRRAADDLIDRGLVTQSNDAGIPAAVRLRPTDAGRILIAAIGVDLPDGGKCW